MRQSVFIIASIAMWGLVTPPAWCQPSTSGANQGAGQTGAQSGTSASSANQANPGATNQNVSPQNQPIANAGNPLGTATPQGAQPGQTGSAENLQQQWRNQQLSEQQGRAQQQQQNQQQLNQQQLNQSNQLQTNQFDRRATHGRSTARQGLSRPADRATAVDRLRRTVPQFDDWRMVEHGNRWWYWTPERNWMYFNDGNWSAFRGGMADQRRSRTTDNLTFPTGFPRDDWRAVNHNGRWWYWTPDESWMYLNNGRWNALRDQATALRQNRSRQQYGAGYRGQDGRLRDGQRRADQSADGQTFDDSRTDDESQRMMFEGPDADHPFMQPGQDADTQQPGGQDAGAVPPGEPQPPAEGEQQSPQTQNGQTDQIDSTTPLGTNETGSGIGLPDQQSSEQSE
jgi:hypothetical protein